MKSNDRILRSDRKQSEQFLVMTKKLRLRFHIIEMVDIDHTTLVDVS